MPGNTEARSVQTGGDEAAALREGALTLDQVKLNIGDSIQLQFQTGLEPTRCFVTLIGYLEGQSIVVTTPVLNGSLMLVREGQDFVVRLFSGKSVYAFAASARRVTNTPYPHLHLSYPREVRGLVVRNAPRSRINIICHATTEAGKGHACLARDISMGGALIASGDKVGDVGDPITLKLRVKVGEAEHLLGLKCRIRSVNTSRPTMDDKPTVLHGLCFEEVSSQDTLVISALLYQNMINAQAAEVQG
ncbi:MAG: flagellar brake protein [Pseudomonadota bacterium]